MPEIQRADDAEPRNLPAVPGAAGLEPGILEGEIVDRPPPSAPARVVQVVRVIVQHEHAKRAGRHLGYIPLGAAVVVRRLWDSRTTARYERWLRIAETSGDQASALEWEKRMADFRRDRHQRRVDMVRVPAELVVQLPKLAFGLVMVLAAIGTLLAVATRHIGEVAVPFEVAARVVEVAVIVVSVAWGPIVLALPWIVMGAFWHVGRVYANAGSGWLAAKKDDGAEDTGHQS